MTVMPVASLSWPPGSLPRHLPPLPCSLEAVWHISLGPSTTEGGGGGDDGGGGGCSTVARTGGHKMGVVFFWTEGVEVSLSVVVAPASVGVGQV